MDKDKKHQLQLSDIGYHGKLIETLSREELLEAISIIRFNAGHEDVFLTPDTDV